MRKRYESRISCSITTRERVKARKRGGQCYDELLQEMVKQYDPEPPEEPGDGVIQGDVTKLPCSVDTRKAIKSLKCGNETYDSVLRRMNQQYDPEKAVTEPIDTDNER